MTVRFCAITYLLAAAAPMQASDWYYVDSARNLSNISFIDKDSIRTNAQGNITGSMYSVLAAEEDGVVAYRFVLEVDCRTMISRMTAAESFDARLVSSGLINESTPWEEVEQGQQSETITAFLCSRGANPIGPSLGSAYPFQKARAMLAERRAAQN